MRRRFIERDIERVEGGYVPTAYARKYAQPDQPQPQQAQPDQPEEQVYTSRETAARYPWIERIEREKAEAAKGASYLVAQGMKQSEADKIIKEQIELTKQANRAAVQNQILQSKLQLEQNTKDLNAHNEFLQAKSAIAKVGFTDADAIERAAKLQSEFGQRLVGTKYEKEFQDSVQNLTSIADRHQQAMHRKFIEDPARQAEIARVRAVAEQEALQPFKKEARQEAMEAAKQEAILKLAAQREIPISESSKILSGEGGRSYVSQLKERQLAENVIKTELANLGSRLEGQYKIKGGLESPVKMLDEKGNATKDPNKAVTSVFIDPTTKKPTIKIPEEDRQAYLQKFNSLYSELENVGKDTGGVQPTSQIPTGQAKPLITPTTQAAPVSQPPVAEPSVTPAAEARAMPASEFSKKNPYAKKGLEERGQKEAIMAASIPQEKAAKEQAERARRGEKLIAAQVNLSKANQEFQNILEGKFSKVSDMRDATVNPDTGAVEPSAEDKAKQYEDAKKRLEEAQSQYDSVIGSLAGGSSQINKQASTSSVAPMKKSRYNPATGEIEPVE